MNGRIAFISEHASPLATLGGVDNGGQNVYVAQLARALVSLGYSVDVFTRRDDPELEEIYPWEKGLRIIHVPAGPAKYVHKEKLLPYMQQFTNYMADFIRSQPQAYNLIHANFWMSGLVAANLKRELGIPFVITFHALGRVRRLYQGNKDDFPDVRFEIEERIVREADLIIAECPQDQQDLVQFYQANPKHITIVPAGFDPQEIMPVDKSTARKQLGLSDNDFIVLQLGRMVARKGVDNVILGVGSLARKYGVEARLLVVGGESEDPDPKITPELARLTALAQENQIQNQVVFIGRRGRDLLKYYYSAADVFVSTPWYEPFGITPLEAMACGTPVIGARVGGIQYSVEDGKTGFLIPPNEPEALAERLAELYHNPRLRKRLGKQAIQRVQKHFTWAQIARSMSAVYEKILRTQSSPDLMEPQEALIYQAFSELADVLKKSQALLSSRIVEAGQAASAALSHGKQILVCGNGGSAADAQHFAAELTGRFKKPVRKALPVLALNADPVLLTAWANDVSYETVFSRQVEAFGREGDVLIAISTSGNSKNVIEACLAAQKRGMFCLALVGKDGGQLAGMADLALIVPSTDTAHIQEVHILILHLLCDMIEQGVGAQAAKEPRKSVQKTDLKTLDYDIPVPSGFNGRTRHKVGEVTKSMKNREVESYENTRWESRSGNRRSPRIGRSHLP